MLDSIYDPFGTPTDEFSFLNVERFIQEDFNESGDGNVYYVIELGSKNKIQ